MQRSLWWAGAIGVALVILLTRLQLSFDLSAFFPRHTTLAHEVLIEQVRNGPASRLLVVGIGAGETGNAVEAARLLQQELAGNPGFVSVLNGEFDEQATDVPFPVSDYYLVMDELDFSAGGLRGAIEERLRDLSFGGGAELLELVSRDPYLATLDVLESLAPAELGGDPWVAANGSAVLLAETTAASIDIAAQAGAVDAVQTAFRALPGSDALTLDVTGVGAFSVELQETIRAEATLRSVLASFALLLVLYAVFRNVRMLFLAALPLLTGFLAGLTTVAVLFETVHGITLAFGFTLLGVAIDYPLHLFSHARHDSGVSAMQRIWPTMRLGAASTVIAYLALVFSNSTGLAQLGVFTAVGVITASLATRTWLPHLLPGGREQAAGADRPAAPRLSLAVAAGALVLAVAVAWPRFETGLWDDNLSSLSPVAGDRLQADQVLRSAAVTADLRYQLTLRADSLEQLLRNSEAMDAILADAVGKGILDGWQSVTRILPSERSQASRQAMIPERDVLAARVAAAVADTPFRADAFDAFLDAAEAARAAPILTAAAIEDSPLRAWLDAHLVQLDDRWVALTSLVQVQPDALARHIAAHDVAADLVDFQNASLDLMRDYRNTALRTILMAAIVIVGLLWWVRGRLFQTLWTGLTVTASLLVTVAIIGVVHGSLTVIHMVALLLVLGLGLDYALFLSRSEPAGERRATDTGVLACAASTTVAFTILAASSIPVLKFLGLTVATGSLASFAIAWGGSRRISRRVS
ncbi:MAG: MMPL family transporter [Woeseiaceae bacterium]|nr:MMPL family transporter [Woeseiaceae bacterium]